MDEEFTAKPRRAAKCRGLPVHARGIPAAARTRSRALAARTSPAGPHQGDGDAVELNQQLLRIALDQLPRLMRSRTRRPAGFRSVRRYHGTVKRRFRRYRARSDLNPDSALAVRGLLASAASLTARCDAAPMVFPRPVMILLIALQASLPDAMTDKKSTCENIDVREFRARRCRFRRSGSATRDRSASRISCRRQSVRFGRWR